MRKYIRDEYDYTKVAIKAYRDYVSDFANILALDIFDKAKSVDELEKYFDKYIYPYYFHLFPNDLKEYFDQIDFKAGKDKLRDSITSVIYDQADADMNYYIDSIYEKINSSLNWKLSHYPDKFGKTHKADWYADYGTFNKLYAVLMDMIADYDKYNDRYYELVATPDYKHFKIDLGRETWYLDEVSDEEWDMYEHGEW